MIISNETSHVTLLDLGLAIRLPAPCIRLLPPSHKCNGAMADAPTDATADAPLQTPIDAPRTTTADLYAGFGIRGYKAPEVKRRRPYGTPVDIFGYGRILYKSLCVVLGRPPRAVGPRALRAMLIESVDDGCGFAWASSSTCWAYETVHCEVRGSARWPVLLSDLVKECLAVAPAARPDAPTILTRLETHAHATQAEGVAAHA